MFPTPKEVIVTIRGEPFKKHVILADVNIPYKFSIDRVRNNLFFCMNADEFSDQSFHSVVLNLETGSTGIVRGIRNGFASAVNHHTGEVFLGGSDGIFPYNYSTNDISQPAVVSGVDIFDMYHSNDLYFVDTSSQTLHVHKNGKTQALPYCKGHLIHHFAIDDKGNLFFANPTGLYMITSGGDSALLVDDADLHYRGATVDANGIPHFITQDGIYAFEKHTRQLQQVLPVDNGYGLSFDKNNNIIYSDERSVIKLMRY